MKKMIGAGFVVGALFLGWSLASLRVSGARAASPQSASRTEFPGKLLYVHVMDTESWWGLFQDVEIREIGGNAFLVGNCVYFGEGDKLIVSARIWTPIDNLKGFYEFNSYEEFKKTSGVMIEAKKAVQGPALKSSSPTLQTLDFKSYTPMDPPKPEK